VGAAETPRKLRAGPCGDSRLVEKQQRWQRGAPAVQKCDQTSLGGGVQLTKRTSGGGGVGDVQCIYCIEVLIAHCLVAAAMSQILEAHRAPQELITREKRREVSKIFFIGNQ
jgi:hypothetical protein